jgi:hypothetical protein
MVDGIVPVRELICTANFVNPVNSLRLLGIVPDTNFEFKSIETTTLLLQVIPSHGEQIGEEGEPPEHCQLENATKVPILVAVIKSHNEFWEYVILK